MNTLSVEYCHIYTNNKIGEEHERSVKLLSGIRQELQEKHESMCLVVMVDDYSFPDPTFDYNKLSEWLDGYRLKPDLMIRESQLMPVCDQVIGLINDQKLKSQLVDYIQSKKYPCSLFIAAWYLVRLGYIDSPLLPEDMKAERLLNLLPESFKPFEEQGLKIIGSTKFTNALEKIDYQYFEGRLIA